MSMQERTDDQLDDLFRKSAEEFDPPFDPAAWQAMRSRLDAHDRPQTPFGSLLRWGLPGLLLLLLTVGGWYAYRTNKTRNVPAMATTERKPTTDAPADANRTDAENRLSAEPNRANNVPTRTKSAPSESEKLSELAGAEPTPTKPAGPNLNRKSSSLTGTRSTVDRSTEPTDLRSATARPLGNRRQPTGETVATVKSVPAQAATNAVANGIPRNESVPSTDPTGPALHDKSTSIRARNPLATNGTASSTRRRRLKETVANTPSRRPAVSDAVGSEPAAGESAKNNVNTGKRTNNGTTLTDRQLSDLEREVNGRPDNLTKLDRQPQTSQPSSDVNPDRTAFSQNALSIGNAPTPTNEPAIRTIGTLAIRPQRWPRPVFALNRDMTTQPDEELEPRRPVARPTPTQGLSLRFLVAPDLSAVGLRNFERPGTNVGLLVEYRLASRWSVQTGVIKSAKNYKAYPADYQLTGYFHVLPESVSGRCSVLDIPINLRYDWAIRPGSNGQAASRWFVSGGVTSYIVQREDYYYNYADPNDPHISANRKSWHSDSTSRYNISQLNLSFGYERALSRRLSWQIEPFMKVPLRGIGYLKIDLLSTGAFFSLRYRL